VNQINQDSCRIKLERGKGKGGLQSQVKKMTKKLVKTMK